MSDEIDYDAEEAALDAEIASLLNPSPEQDTDDKTQISAEPTSDVDTSAIDQTETEPAKEPTVPESRYKNLQAKMTQVSQENADLRRYLAQLQEQVNQLQAQHQQQSSAPDTDDDLDALESDYPEIATPLVKRNKMLEQKIAQLEAKLGTVADTASRFQQHEAQTAAERHAQAIKAVHPDFDEIAASPDLFEWADTQPPIIQNCVRNGCSPQDAIMVLNLYKQAKGLDTESPEPVDKLAAAKQAASPKVPKNPGKPTTNKTNWTREQIAKMSIEEFAKHEAEIDEAMALGLI